MSNPSLVWAQLSLPNSPVGSIPFVAPDGASILTDVLNFFYNSTNLNLYVSNGIVRDYTDTTATPGNVVINEGAGRVKIAAAQTVLVVTNQLVAIGDIVQVIIETADATFTRAIGIAGAGNITITGNAAATGAVVMSFILQKVV